MTCPDCHGHAIDNPCRLCKGQGEVKLRSWLVRWVEHLLVLVWLAFVVWLTSKILKR